MKGYDGIFVDEVHYGPDWARHLKAAYDAFPGHRVLAGGSSTIALHSKISDLSRRFPIHTMPLLSFREYLMLVLNKEIEPVNPFDAPKKQIRTLARETNILRHFNHYMAGGFRPFFLEEQELYLEKVMNTVTKTMEADIPFPVPSLTEQHLRLMHAVIGYLAVSNVPTLQINSLCREWSIGKEKLYQLLNAMERAHLIQIVRKRNDTKMNSVGAKLLLQEPSIYSFFGRNTGTRREAYVVRALSDAGHSVYASANETDCDFIAGELRIEVGGARKNIKAADFVIRDNLDLPSGNSLPLWLPGLGY